MAVKFHTVHMMTSFIKGLWRRASMMVLWKGARLGFAVRTSGAKGECVTPTGIALAAAFRTRDSLPRTYRVLGVGTGLGKRDYGRPAILRIMRIEAVTDGRPEVSE